MSLIKSFSKTAIFGTLAILAGSAFAAGHISEDVAKAMEARSAHMSLNSFYLSTLGGMAQDKIPYDAAAAATAATNLAALASIDQSAYWIEGSDTTIEGSRAKPEIWTDYASFLEKQTELATAATSLAAVAGDGLESLKGAFGPVGGACGSCHKAYRTPRD